MNPASLASSHPESFSHLGVKNAIKDDRDESPVEYQLRLLEGRLESITNLLAELTRRAGPVLREDEPMKGASTLREAGQSPLHEHLALLNEKASDIAAYVDHTIGRFTI